MCGINLTVFCLGRKVARIISRVGSVTSIFCILFTTFILSPPNPTLAVINGLDYRQQNSQNLQNLQDTPVTASPFHGSTMITSSSVRVAVLYDSSGLDKEMQQEMLKAVFISLRDIDQDDVSPMFLDMASSSGGRNRNKNVEWVWGNKTQSVISLLDSPSLAKFISSYETLVSRSVGLGSPPVLKIFTPRLVNFFNSNKTPSSPVILFSLQMQGRAMSVALLNRVEKVGIKTLVPILDSGDVTQHRLLNEFIAAGEQRLEKIFLTKPIYLDNPAHLASFRGILEEYSGLSNDKLGAYDDLGKVTPKPQLGVLMLASKGSQLAMKVAAEKNHMQVGWFSPNLLNHEEWAYNSTSGGNNTTRETSTGATYNNNTDNSNANVTVNPYFGLYTLSFVGSRGWDNAERRRALRQLTTYTGASPRILSSILAYDSGTLAVLSARSSLSLPFNGLSGEIGFDSRGFRRDGVFFGVSAVPDLASPTVTLLQPSTWILEDTISIMETIEGQFLIQDYEVATSSVLHGEELRSLAKQSKTVVEGCGEHVMNLITHDPFNQMPYNYYFKEANLPESMLIPNQHGFGITFLCFHVSHSKRNGSDPNSSKVNEPMTTTLQIACTPGSKFHEPIKCFRSHVRIRQKRSPGDVPQTQYQYGIGGINDDMWNHLPQNSKWSSPKDDDSSSNYYYYKGPSTPGPYFYKRQDTSVSAAAEVSTTPAPSPTSKLPELRQILKAAKPFVGSCIGSTTGCAMCVLVLGRLPLGAVPAACTGPCFVGTFGSCGSLLGRVFSETTVICTELFKQGYMDQETFFADVEFGRMMTNQFPTTMEGYKLLATPLVDVMKTSPLLTNAISYFALPWAHHMKYLMGRTNTPNLPGLLIHTIGFPICSLAGQIYSGLRSQFHSIYSFFTFSSTLPLTTITLAVVVAILTGVLTKTKLYFHHRNRDGRTNSSNNLDTKSGNTISFKNLVEPLVESWHQSLKILKKSVPFI